MTRQKTQDCDTSDYIVSEYVDSVREIDSRAKVDWCGVVNVLNAAVYNGRFQNKLRMNRCVHACTYILAIICTRVYAIGDLKNALFI